MKTINVQTKIMRTITLSAVLMAATGAAFGQQKEVVNAYNYMKGQEWIKAAEAIDKAIADPSTSDKEKTWRYRGDIYLGLATSQKEADRTFKPNPVEESIRSYQKAFDLGSKYGDDMKQKMVVAHTISLNTGVELFNKGKYTDAMQNFENAIGVSKVLKFTDTLSHFNAALTAERMENYSKAVEFYEACIKFNYQTERIYGFMAQALANSGETDKMLAKLAEGRAKFPENQDLIIMELNHYLKNDDMDGAKRNLQKAIEKDPSNHILYYSLGTVYNNLGLFAEAEQAYNDAIKINGNYFDTQYNLGALYFNQGVLKFQEADKIQDAKKNKAVVDEANSFFAKAIGPLERAHALNPDDMATMDSLSKLYIRVGEDDKYLAMKKKMEKK
jgi:tetratricopeptide (TPR) repeat protein